MITWAIAHIKANGTLPCKLKPSQILMVSTNSRVFFEEDNFARQPNFCKDFQLPSG
jgi:hypothetical protein